MAICSYCGVAQPQENFEVASVLNGKVYRRRKCKTCKRETQSKRRAKLKAWLEQYKTSLQCEKCGYSDYRALEFHHRDSQGKDFNVGDMVRMGLSIDRIGKEIAKCHVLCANCHRILHYK